MRHLVHPPYSHNDSPTQRSVLVTFQPLNILSRLHNKPPDGLAREWQHHWPGPRGLGSAGSCSPDIGDGLSFENVTGLERS